MLVPGTPRDSLFILDTLLNLDGGVRPEMVATNNASDMVFGIFKMLGFRFAPRFRDLADERFWRAEIPVGEPQAGYGPLKAIARNKVNLRKIREQWPDMLRVAGSLITNQVRAYDLLRMFGREGHPTPLGQAFAEYGRIEKTFHLFDLVDPVDDTYRRRMNRQLTVQESRHTLARAICHGKRGHIQQAYRDGQEDQLASLELVLNAVVLWNTRYLDAVVETLRALPAEQREHDGLDEDVARLSPLKAGHLTSWAGTPSRPPNPRTGCGRCATRQRWTKTTRSTSSSVQRHDRPPHRSGAPGGAEPDRGDVLGTAAGPHRAGAGPAAVPRSGTTRTRAVRAAVASPPAGQSVLARSRQPAAAAPDGSRHAG